MIFFYIIRQVAPKIINLEQRHEGLAEISASPSFLHIYTFILNFIYLIRFNIFNSHNVCINNQCIPF